MRAGNYDDLRRFSGQYLDVNTKVINGLHLTKVAFQHIIIDNIIFPRSLNSEIQSRQNDGIGLGPVCRQIPGTTYNDDGDFWTVYNIALA